MDERRIQRLERLAATAHAGQLDLQGAPYILHLRAVADAVSDAAKPVALFHDSLEDGKLTAHELAHVLTADEFVAVQMLTRDNRAESYASFIARIASADGVAGELAREVKRADVRHNLGRLTPNLERLRERYERALEAL